MPESVTEVYKWVVDDVIQKVQELFVQEGIEQYVQELLCFVALMNLLGWEKPQVSLLGGSVLKGRGVEGVLVSSQAGILAL